VCDEAARAGITLALMPAEHARRVQRAQRRDSARRLLAGNAEAIRQGRLTREDVVPAEDLALLDDGEAARP
jgi:hypothetical protein